MSIVTEFNKSGENCWELKGKIDITTLLNDLGAQEICYLVITDKVFLVRREAITGIKIRRDTRKPPQADVIESLGSDKVLDLFPNVAPAQTQE